jgi:DNA mismatch repair protein MutS2
MGTELDLHRLTVEEALPQMHYVRIVHGKGSGALRQAVSRYLATHPLVKSYHPSDRYNGGPGATEVVLIDK